MGVDVIHDREKHEATIHCTVVGWSLGPTFEDNEETGFDAGEVAEIFLRYMKDIIGRDPRMPESHELESYVTKFHSWFGSQAFCDGCRTFKPCRCPEEDEDEKKESDR